MNLDPPKPELWELVAVMRVEIQRHTQNSRSPEERSSPELVDRGSQGSELWELLRIRSGEGMIKQKIKTK